MPIRELVKKAHQLWDIDYVPPHVQRHNRKQWLRSVMKLGDHWIAHKRVPRLEKPRD